ncbi:MAG: mediator of RNA polymerase II transcription subunit 13 [Alyxoria varia]|nr:MAG: mediator of RNA polymerase II transcription subunit 13 [Alyxoria varia]
MDLRMDLDNLTTNIFTVPGFHKIHYHVYQLKDSASLETWRRINQLREAAHLIQQKQLLTAVDRHHEELYLFAKSSFQLESVLGSAAAVTSITNTLRLQKDVILQAIRIGQVSSHGLNEEPNGAAEFVLLERSASGREEAPNSMIRSLFIEAVIGALSFVFTSHANLVPCGKDHFEASTNARVNLDVDLLDDGSLLVLPKQSFDLDVLPASPQAEFDKPQEDYFPYNLSIRLAPTRIIAVHGASSESVPGDSYNIYEGKDWKKRVQKHLSRFGIDSEDAEDDPEWTFVKLKLNNGEANGDFVERGNQIHIEWPSGLCLGIDCGEQRMTCSHPQGCERDHKTHVAGLEWFPDDTHPPVPCPIDSLNSWLAKQQMPKTELDNSKDSPQVMSGAQHFSNGPSPSMSQTAAITNDSQTAGAFYPTPSDGPTSKNTPGAVSTDIFEAQDSNESWSQDKDEHTSKSGPGSPMQIDEDFHHIEEKHVQFDVPGITDEDFDFFDDPQDNSSPVNASLQDTITLDTNQWGPNRISPEITNKTHFAEHDEDGSIHIIDHAEKIAMPESRTPFPLTPYTLKQRLEYSPNKGSRGKNTAERFGTVGLKPQEFSTYVQHSDQKYSLGRFRFCLEVEAEETSGSKPSPNVQVGVARRRSSQTGSTLGISSVLPGSRSAVKATARFLPGVDRESSTSSDEVQGPESADSSSDSQSSEDITQANKLYSSRRSRDSLDASVASESDDHPESIIADGGESAFHDEASAVLSLLLGSKTEERNSMFECSDVNITGICADFRNFALENFDSEAQTDIVQLLTHQLIGMDDLMATPCTQQLIDALYHSSIRHSVLKACVLHAFPDASSSALIDFASKERRDDLFKIDLPQIRMKKAGSDWEVLPTGLAFWDTLGLEPKNGPKDVEAYCVYPENPALDHSENSAIDSFLQQIKDAYHAHQLGKYTLGQSHTQRPGLIPVRLQGVISVSAVLNAYRQACVDFGRLSSTRTGNSNRTVVIQLINPFTEPRFIYAMVACFYSLFTAVQQGQKPVPSLSLSIVSVNEIAEFGAPKYLDPNKAFRIALNVYDTCRVNERSVVPVDVPVPTGSAFELAEPPPTRIPFELNQKPPGNLFLQNSCLHVAYCVSSDGQWITASWSDNFGKYQHLASYRAEDHHYEDVLKEMWETTTEIVKARNVRWRLFIAKCSRSMSCMERNQWLKLFNLTGTPSCSTSLLCVDSDPFVSIYSKDQLGTTLFPMDETMEDTAKSSLPDLSKSTSEHLVDMRDESWGLILPYKRTISSGNDRSWEEAKFQLSDSYHSPKATGLLLKRRGVDASHALATMQVDLLHTVNTQDQDLDDSERSPLKLDLPKKPHQDGFNENGGRRPDDDCRSLLKEILVMYRNLSVLASLKGVKDANSTAPWHIAAVEKGAVGLMKCMKF